MIGITYRSLRSYRYQLMATYTIELPWLGGYTVASDWLQVCDGYLTISAGYAWDGPSGPTWDTASSMRGSLVHDALYQLIREGLIGCEWREQADKELRRICVEDGMSNLRAALWYRALRLAGARSAKRR